MVSICLLAPGLGAERVDKAARQFFQQFHRIGPLHRMDDEQSGSCSMVGQAGQTSASRTRSPFRASVRIADDTGVGGQAAKD